ncbi:hypothetical protein G7047_19860 [Diaphorobacter sp. HDW4A]|uniref:hypothetical protein n=1 Tax=Diaphorobacter sp. HDW4A TaxID=2714924 RepID=UPI0014079308|nr:hypothetical protein [Diaphorobacter sp. HDW4A]QIL81926.1 hypothetical protein G7047_19860 [Diaphorobacter sp. HDW4A]
MKTFFFRSARMTPRSRNCAAEVSSAAASTASPKPLQEQLRELDTLTGWPTHRIRSFLVTQSRGAR